MSTWIKQITGNDKPLFFMLGPCSMESEEHTLMMAEHLATLSQKLNFSLIFKSSFDKANRMSLTSYRSLGIDKGLATLQKVKEQFNLPIVTDIHDVTQVDRVAEIADVIQIPAFLCRQTDLLTAAGKTGKTIFVKKGQFYMAEHMDCVIDKITSTGNESVFIGERGFTFGYSNLVVDFRNFPVMKSFGKPVVFDVTHAVQRPGGKGTSSGGNREFVAALAASGVVHGIAGLFMEVYDVPEKAGSDGPNSIRLSQLEGLITYLMDLDAFAKSKPIPQVD